MIEYRGEDKDSIDKRMQVYENKLNKYLGESLGSANCKVMPDTIHFFRKKWAMAGIQCENIIPVVATTITNRAGEPRYEHCIERK